MSEYGNAYIYQDKVEVELPNTQTALSIPLDPPPDLTDRDGLTNRVADLLAGQRWSIDNQSWHRPRTADRTWLLTAFAWRHS